jgi:DeoR/GlpR family transcriptional regulator of sugar metabolism
MSMLANQRRDQIIRLLREDGSAKVTDLARLFKVSEVSIRQDLEKLEKEELIGKKAAGLIENDDAIILDSDTTTTEIAKQFRGRRNTRSFSEHMILNLSSHETNKLFRKYSQ